MSRDITTLEALQYSEQLKKMFWKAPLPPHVLPAVLTLADDIFKPLGIKNVKLRSSSNAEDLPGFNGAGLYDSFGAILGLVRFLIPALLPSSPT